MRCFYSFFNSIGEGNCLTGTKLGDVGWVCLQSETQETDRKTYGEGAKEVRGELKSIRNSETLWIW